MGSCVLNGNCHRKAVIRGVTLANALSVQVVLDTVNWTYSRRF